jgi:hypothetical protein
MEIKNPETVKFCILNSPSLNFIFLEIIWAKRFFCKKFFL